MYTYLKKFKFDGGALFLFLMTLGFSLGILNEGGFDTLDKVVASEKSGTEVVEEFFEKDNIDQIPNHEWYQANTND